MTSIKKISPLKRKINNFESIRVTDTGTSTQLTKISSNSNDSETMNLDNEQLHYDNWDTNHEYGYTEKSYETAKDLDASFKEIINNSEGFTKIASAYQESLNNLKSNYYKAADNTNVTLDSKYNFITSLETYTFNVSNGKDEIFVFNTETEKYEKTTVEQWVSYLINGGYFDFNVENPNSPITINYTDDGESIYNVNFDKLKQYYDDMNIKNGNGVYIVDKSDTKYNNMVNDYNNLSNLYQQYCIFAPYMANFITTQVVASADSKYSSMTEEQLNSNIEQISNVIGMDLSLGLFRGDLDEILTREQKIALLTVYETEGNNAANQYIKTQQEILVQTKALMQVEERLKFYVDDNGKLNIDELEKDIENGNIELDEDLGTFLLSGGYGLYDGACNFLHGLSMLDIGKMSVGEYKRMYFAMAIANSSTLNANYNLGSAIGQMAPVIASTYVLNQLGLSSGAISLISGTLNSFSIYGNTLDKSITAGYSTEQAIEYAALTAIVNASSEYLLGGLPGLSKNVGNLSITLQNALKNMAKEGLEEGLEEFVDAGIRSVILEEPIDIEQLGEDAFNSFIYGVLVSGFYNGLDGTFNIVKNSVKYEVPIKNLANFMVSHPTELPMVAVNEFFKQYYDEINGRSDYLMQFSNGNDTYFGADQNAGEKHLYSYLWDEINYRSLGQFLNEERLMTFLTETKGMSEVEAEQNIFELENKVSNEFLYSSDVDLLKEYIASLDIYSIEEKNEFLTNIFPVSEKTRLIAELEKFGVTSEYDAQRIMSCVNSTGACSYAAVANVILMQFSNNPSKFEETFGYPMYVKINGETRLNSSELILDMYTYLNSDKCGGSLFKYNQNGELEINGDLDTSNQKYLSKSFSGVDTKLVNQFLSSKSREVTLIKKKTIPFSHNSSVTTNPTEANVLNIRNDINKWLLDGGEVDLGIYKTSKDIRLLVADNPDIVYISTSTWDEGGGHAVAITGVNEIGYEVSSWGQKLIIPFEDLIDNDFTINFVKLKGVE